MLKQGLFRALSLLTLFLSKFKQKFYEACQVIGYSVLLSHLTFIPYVHAGPVGGEVIGGTGSISQSGLTTVIDQVSNRMAINWDSYDIAVDESVQYNQINPSDISLNLILSNQGSVIQGQIDATGTVILVNTSGILFSETSQLNVGGLIASGLHISPENFMNGEYIFNEVLGADGTVINRGLINASLGGNVALVGKQVKNEGVINANLGSAILASGKQAVLIFDDQALIGVKITKEILQDELGLDPAVVNSGEINAQGGRVLLTASASRDVFSQAVNAGEMKHASSVLVNEDGSFSLSAGADVLNSGKISVNAASENSAAGDVVIIGENITHSGVITADSNSGVAGNIELHANDKTELIETAIVSAQAKTGGVGGNIKLLGDKVGLFDTAEVNASGANGGGEVLIGGDKQGLNNNVRNAEFVYLGEKTAVSADAQVNGDGGKIITYADNTARIYGDLIARGGMQAGNGGFIETSGKQSFDISGAPDVSASAGEGGLWLIDPYNITIVDGIDGSANSNVDVPAVTATNVYTSTDTPSVIETFTILEGLAGGDVEIRTVAGDGGLEDGDINFGDVVGGTSTTLDYNGTGTSSLTLWAEGDIVFTAGSKIWDSTNAVDSLNVNLFAKGDVSIGSGVEIITQGGNYTVGFDDTNATNDDFIPINYTSDILSRIITSGLDDQAAGNVTITSSGIITTRDIKANGGTATTGNNGTSGGLINISGVGNVIIGNDISTIGSPGVYSNNNGGEVGGAGGAVSVSSSSGSVTVRAITTNGGDGDGDSSDEANGGIAGSISLTATTDLTLNGILSAQGGAADASGGSPGTANGGAGNTVTLNANNTIIGSDILTMGGAGSGAGFDGTGGNIIINSAVKLTGNVFLDSDKGSKAGSTDGAITITGNIDNNTPGSTLSALIIDSGTSSTSIIGSIGGTNAIESFTISEASVVDVDAIRTMDGGVSIDSASTIDLGGNIVTSADPVSETAGDLLLNSGAGELILSADVTLDTNASSAVIGADVDKDIIIAASINADDGINNNRFLTIDAGNESVSLQDVGTTANKQLQGFSVTANTKTTLNGDINTKGGGVDITSATIDVTAPSITINTDLAASGNAGPVAFRGVSKLFGDLTIDADNAGLGGSVLFTGAVDANNKDDNILLDITAGSGDVIFNSALGVAQDLQSLTIYSANDVQLKQVRTRTGGVDISSTSIALAGNIVTDDLNDAGSVSLDVGLTGIILLNADTTIDTNSSNDQSIIITGDIESASGFSLSLDAGSDNTGTITVNGDIGSDIAAVRSFSILNAFSASLDGINTLDGGVSIVNTGAVGLGGNINTARDNDAGLVSISAPITLEADTTITTDGPGGAASDESITFTNTIDGAFSLELNAGSQDVTLSGAIGSGVALTGFSVNSSRDTFLNADIITNAGDVSFTGDVTLSGATRNITTNGNATSGNVTFVNRVNGATALEIDAGAADVSFQQAVGGLTGLASLTVLNAKDLNLQKVDSVGNIDAQSVSGVVNLFDNLDITGTNGGSINLGGDVILNNNIVLTTAANGSDGAVNIVGQVDSLVTAPVGTFYTLEVQAGDGVVTLADNVGLGTELGSLNVNTTSSLSINSVYTTNSATSTGNIRLVANAINLNGDLDTTAGIVSALDLTGQISINGDITLLGNSSLNTDSIISLVDNQVIVNDTVSGGFDFDVTVGAHAATFSSAINTKSFSVNQGLLAANTGVVDLQSVTTTDGDIDITSRTIILNDSLTSDTVSATGDITLTGDVKIAGTLNIDSSLANADIIINGNMLANDTTDLFKLSLLSGAGNSTVNGDIGSATLALGGFEIDTTGNAYVENIFTKNQGVHITANQITLAGAEIKSNLTSAGSADSITFDGNVLLASDVAIKTNTGTSAGSAITVNGLIDADDNSLNTRSLTLSSGSEITTINGNIGTSTNGALEKLTVTSASEINLDRVLTGSGGIALTGGMLNLNGNLLSNDAVSAGLVDLTISGNIVLGANVLIRSDSSLNDNNIVISAADIRGADTYSLSLDAGDANVTLLTSVSDVTDFNVLESGASSITGDVSVSGTGQLNINANNGVSLAGSYSTADGAILIDADVDSDQIGNLTLAAGSDLTTVDRDVLLKTASLSFANSASIDSGTAQTTINSTGDLSVGTAFSGLSVTDAVLGRITAGTLVLSAEADVYVDSANSTHVTSLESANGNINFVGGDSSFNELNVLTTNDVLLNSTVTASNNLAVTAANIDTTNVNLLVPAGSFNSINSNVILNANLSGDRTLNLIAQNGEIDLQDASFTNLDSMNVDATNIVYSAINPVSTINNIDILITTDIATPEFIQSVNLTSTQGAISITTNNDLTFDAASTLSAATSVNLTSDLGDIQVASVSATSGDIYVSALQGAIIDNNGSNNNFAANLVHLRADTGIGAADVIETVTSELNVANITGGTVSLNNTGDVTLTELVNVGDINFVNSSNVTINNVDADFDTGIFDLTVTNGSVTPTGLTPDITAFEVAIAVNGSFSVFTSRPIVLNVKNRAVIASAFSNTLFLPADPINGILDTSDIQISVLDSIGNVSGQQLIEVESLADIDPAIFTELNNYNQQDISIRMPRDQVFEDELDIYDQL